MKIYLHLLAKIVKCNFYCLKDFIDVCTNFSILLFNNYILTWIWKIARYLCLVGKENHRPHSSDNPCVHLYFDMLATVTSENSITVITVNIVPWPDKKVDLFLVVWYCLVIKLKQNNHAILCTLLILTNDQWMPML